MKSYSQYRYKSPLDATELLLIRHGDTQALKEGASFPLKDGQSDPLLNARGHRQAEALAAHLGEEGALKSLYVTPLQRTHQTAAPLVKRGGLSPSVIADLREVHLGTWEGGISRIKANERDPLFEKVYQDGEWGHIAGAETSKAFSERVTGALRRVAKAHKGEKIAIITHQGVISAALEWASGAKAFAFFSVAHGAISRLIIGDDYCYIRSFNEIGHLVGDEAG